MLSAVILFFGLAGTYVCDTANKNRMEGFIVGGKYISVESFPHVAYLSIKCVLKVPLGHKTVQTVGCGSTILNQYILLTAAHCLHDCQYHSNIDIKVGSEDTRKGIVYSSEKFIIHPEFSIKSMANDIALVKTRGKLQFGQYVKRAALLRQPPRVKRAYVSGWGLIDELNSIGTYNLKLAAQDLMPRELCLQVLPKLPRGTFCGEPPLAQSPEHGFAAQGDSGSGLIYSTYIVIGLVSFKYPKLDTTIAIYTDVSYFYDWILRTSKNLYCGK